MGEPPEYVQGDTQPHPRDVGTHPRIHGLFMGIWSTSGYSPPGMCREFLDNKKKYTKLIKLLRWIPNGLHYCLTECCNLSEKSLKCWGI